MVAIMDEMMNSTRQTTVNSCEYVNLITIAIMADMYLPAFCS